MIERYSHPTIAAFWTDAHKFYTWFRVEMAILQALENEKIIPAGITKTLGQKSKTLNWKVIPGEILEAEAITKHDMIAFLTVLEKYLGEESRFIHFGVTSSDIVDTGLSMLLRDSGNIIIQEIKQLLEVIHRKALQYKDTLMIGRTHGIIAEPITFGLKFALWFCDLSRSLQRFERAVQEISVGKISGAVGTFAHIPPEVEKQACKILELQPVTLATQVIQRDIHAEYFHQIALIGSILEKIAVEIRHLQRTEVSEASEGFSKGQKGSSAMPHKKNPILSENVTGCARLLRGYAQSAMENIALWHERDISHSSVERIIAPDATTLLGFMLKRTKNILENLHVYPENMLKNLMAYNDVPFTQGVLLKLIQSGMKRQQAYELVQKHALQAFETKTSLFEKLSKDIEIIKYISAETLREILSPQYFIKRIDYIFEQVFVSETQRN